MNPLISCAYVIGTLIYVALLLVIRKTCTERRVSRDVLGLIAMTLMTFGGLCLVNYSYKYYLIIGAGICIFSNIYMLTQKIHERMSMAGLVLVVVSTFAFWPVFFGFNTYYFLNLQEMDKALGIRTEIPGKSDSNDV